MGFKWNDAVDVRDKIIAIGRPLNLKEVQNVLREHTGTMIPWWIQTYMRSMVSSGMLVSLPNGDFKANHNWKPVV